MNPAKIAKRLLDPPLYHTGPEWLNRMGWQVARTSFHHGLHAIRSRPAPVEGIAASLAEGERTGCVVIPNFLAPQDFERLQAYCASLRTSGAVKVDENRGNTGLDFTTAAINGNSPDAQWVVEKIARDARLLCVVGTLSRRHIRRPPQVAYQLLTMRPGADFSPDAETILHADRHFPAVKAYYSLNVSTVENGAYVWCPGSHRLTAARLRHEYSESIRYAKLRDKFNVDIPQKNLDEMGVKEVTILTEPNTLVVSNNFGFHRRGHFERGAVREQLRLVFHYLEEPVYATWAWSVLRKLDRRNLIPPKLRHAIQYRLT